MSAVTDLAQRIQEALAARYRIERELGRGGMATVFLAEDLKHRRPVALKVFQPEIAALIGPARFLREIEIAARLDHPHIVPLYDSGAADGELYYVMPYVAGESLRERLRREGRLAAGDALGIAEQVGNALSYAHSHGVIHRDIKPENVLLAGDQARVTDFGIARAVAAGGEGLTRTGMGLGTPGYMSPEQAGGLRDLDERADVYGLACVVYEMLCGAPPSGFISDESVRLGRFTALPEPHRPPMREAGAVAERALVRALAVRAEDRFASMDAFVRALREPDRVERRYSDGEVEAIVRHAAEEQLAHPTNHGLSLATVMHIAQEVGISPDRVERAARRLEARGGQVPDALATSGGMWLGSSTLIGSERVVEGEAGGPAFDDIVEEIQATLGTRGSVETVGRSLHWRTSKPVLGKRRAIRVRVTPRDGHTRITVQERLNELAWSLFPAFMGVGAGAVAVILSLGGPEFGWLAAGVASGGAFGASYAAARWIFRGIARSKQRDLEGLGDRIATLATAPGRPIGTPVRPALEGTPRPG